jgi:hypothetical protein
VKPLLAAEPERTGLGSTVSLALGDDCVAGV